ncbi:DNA-binding protein HU-beta [Massilia sp. MP_M2]|uniref:HU family DNA-binding protein n=1 Tax=Massilia sp. MP_M2 TaxID=3071713 RepID=UPI00319E72C0
MNKTELVEHIADKHGISKAKAEAIVTSVFSTIIDTVATGGSVRLQNFGLFEAIISKPRPGFLPHTGEKIAIPAVRRPRFTAGSEFKKKTATEQQA